VVLLFHNVDTLVRSRWILCGSWWWRHATKQYLSPAVGSATIFFFFLIDPFINEATIRASMLGLLVRRGVLSFCIRSAGYRFYRCPICKTLLSPKSSAVSQRSPQHSKIIVS